MVSAFFAFLNKDLAADLVGREESIAINKSLFALRQCLNMLSKGADVQHVPYRDSKLTALLSNTLSGKSLSVMLACIAPNDGEGEGPYHCAHWAQAPPAGRRQQPPCLAIASPLFFCCLPAPPAALLRPQPAQLAAAAMCWGPVTESGQRALRDAVQQPGYSTRLTLAT